MRRDQPQPPTAKVGVGVGIRIRQRAEESLDAGLKRHLPQQIPLYGLQSPLFSGGGLPDTIDELAVEYADTVTGVAPSGPIRLLGWSFGGAVALLVAQELTRRGREVSWVGMLDSYPEVADDDAFDPAKVLPGLLREMGFDVDPDTRMTVDRRGGLDALVR